MKDIKPPDWPRQEPPLTAKESAEALELYTALVDRMLSPPRGWRDVSAVSRARVASELAGAVERMGMEVARSLREGGWPIRGHVIEVEVVAPGRTTYVSHHLREGSVELRSRAPLPNGATFAAFQSLGRHLGGDRRPVSAVLAAAVELPNGPPVADLEVFLEFRHAKSLTQNETESVTCVFWSEALNRWSRRGCQLVRSRPNATYCRCTHLTSFAVLLDHHGRLDRAFSPGHRTAQRWISLIGACVSSLLLMYACLCMSVLRRRNAWYFVDLHLCLSLLLAQLLFTVASAARLSAPSGPANTSLRHLCTAVAMALHYLFLCVFMWALNEGIRMYCKLIRVLPAPPGVATDAYCHRAMYWLAYGLPLVIVITSVATALPAYGTQHFCWLAPQSVAMWLFVGPVVVVMAANTVILLVALYRIQCGSRMALQAASRHRRHKIMNITKVFFLMALLGLTWITGLFFVEEKTATLVLSYVFLFTNLLTPLFICLGYRLFSFDIRLSILQYFNRRHLLYGPLRSYTERQSRVRAFKSSHSRDMTTASASGSSGASRLLWNTFSSASTQRISLGRISAASDHRRKKSEAEEKVSPGYAQSGQESTSAN